jgi:hypothetical protein
MNYTKPEVSMIGSASMVIEGSVPKPGNSTDGGISSRQPTAYDLDEE